jgi:hypothetical protein
MKLDPKQSHYVLGVLLDRRKVRPVQVRSILKERESEIAGLRRRLAALEAAANVAGGPAARRPAVRRPRRTSPRLRALRRMQGRYMGFMRRLKPGEKARVRALRGKKGLLPAIRLAGSLARA